MRLFQRLFISKETIPASQNGDIDKMTELLNKGANVNYKGDNNITPLMTAISYSETSSSLDMVKLILGAGANINQMDAEGNIALMYAARYLNFDNSESQKVLKLLLDYGTNVNHKNKAGSTPLDAAITNNSYYAASSLIQHGADVNTKSNFMVTPLMIASAKGNSDIIKLLLEQGSVKNINDFDVRGFNSLKYALDYKNYDAARILLNNGADPYNAFETYQNDNLTKKFLADYIWNIMNNNIKLMSRGKIDDPSINKLPKDIIEIILLKRKQLELCKDLSNNHNILILASFADMLEIPLSDNYTKEHLCSLISKQLSYRL